VSMLMAVLARGRASLRLPDCPAPSPAPPATWRAMDAPPQPVAPTAPACHFCAVPSRSLPPAFPSGR
jgi:hypothetical protein